MKVEVSQSGKHPTFSKILLLSPSSKIHIHSLCLSQTCAVHFKVAPLLVFPNSVVENLPCGVYDYHTRDCYYRGNVNAYLLLGVYQCLLNTVACRGTLLLVFASPALFCLLTFPPCLKHTEFLRLVKKPKAHMGGVNSFYDTHEAYMKGIVI